ncbi:RNA-binding protein rnc1 [Zancudomyces culisetae]|uniref:RNA-binding protein rnc1 n=1 Tax=Zancudomyces culisetae TaxID=1213189 RepID=A0A1R1PVJ9_ZANCU|nr:RNA-binding protein rnc1 [Zancudomyces culisetae]|eukprot:OMH84983.1 RNA-binding protein rnc1 [Zancudomyces culisetae]
MASIEKKSRENENEDVNEQMQTQRQQSGTIFEIFHRADMMKTTQEFPQAPSSDAGTCGTATADFTQPDGHDYWQARYQDQEHPGCDGMQIDSNQGDATTVNGTGEVGRASTAIEKSRSVRQKRAYTTTAGLGFGRDLTVSSMPMPQQQQQQQQQTSDVGANMAELTGEFGRLGGVGRRVGGTGRHMHRMSHVVAEGGGGGSGSGGGGGGGSGGRYRSFSMVQPGGPTGPSAGYIKTQEISIPGDMVGCIIGKGGSRITEIRRISGARIAIAKASATDATADRLFTISGTPECNEKALYLLYGQLEAERERRLANAKLAADLETALGQI